MKVVADRAAVSGAHAPLLLPTSFEATSGETTLVAGDPGYGHVALALALGGRLALSDGSITVGGSTDDAVRRRCCALVDLAGVSEPEDGLKVSAVIAEELAFAGAPSDRAAVRELLEADGAGDLAGHRWEQVPPARRTAWLAGTASRRPGVEVLVLAGPDRFGGDPRDWWAVAKDLAGQGFAVIVLASHASVRLLGEPLRYELGVAR